MHVVGDPQGVAALKALAGTHREFLKFLITEAQSSSDHVAAFRTEAGERWEILYHPTSGELEVRHPRANSRTVSPSGPAPALADPPPPGGGSDPDPAS